MPEISYRLGGKQLGNLYEVTPECPEGRPIGHACKPDPEMAARIVEALNSDLELAEYVVANQKLAKQLVLTQDVLADCRRLLKTLADMAVSGNLRTTAGQLVERIDSLEERADE